MFLAVRLSRYLYARAIISLPAWTLQVSRQALALRIATVAGNRLAARQVSTPNSQFQSADEAFCHAKCLPRCLLVCTVLLFIDHGPVLWPGVHPHSCHCDVQTTAAEMMRCGGSIHGWKALMASRGVEGRGAGGAAHFYGPGKGPQALQTLFLFCCCYQIFSSLRLC